MLKHALLPVIMVLGITIIVMDIIKSLKDYKFSHKQRIFAGFVKNYADSDTCIEKIRNRQFIFQHVSAQNNLLMYSTAVFEPVMLCRHRDSDRLEEIRMQREKFNIN